MVDPLLFYANLCGNTEYEYKADEIIEQFKSDLIAALLPSLTKVAARRVSYDMLPGAVDELTAAIQESLKTEWQDKVGINVDRIKIENVSPTAADAETIQKLQETRVYGNAGFASASKQQAQVGYITGLGEGAAKGGSESGLNGAMGMMGAAMMGGVMGNMGLGNPFSQNQAQAQQQGAPVSAGWVCACDAENTGKFCQQCGKSKPIVKRYKCNKCGWIPENPAKPPKFCPECGDIFNEDDTQA